MGSTIHFNRIKVDYQHKNHHSPTMTGYYSFYFYTKRKQKFHSANHGIIPYESLDNNLNTAFLVLPKLLKSPHSYETMKQKFENQWNNVFSAQAVGYNTEWYKYIWNL